VAASFLFAQTGGTMPLPALYDTVYRVRIVGELHGSVTNNVLHFAAQNVGTPADPFTDFVIQLGTHVLECVVETLLPAVTSDWSLSHVEAQVIHPNITDPIIQAPAVSGQGQRGATSVSFAAQLVNIRSGEGGRRGRGKAFFPPAGEADIAESVTAAANMDLVAAFLACIAGKFIGDAKTTPFHLVVYSRKDDEGVGTTPLGASRLVRTLQAKANVARCGSRKKGRGI
jgi:hypothetical protein